MPAAVETKQTIVTSLAGFASKPLTAAATALFESLGYKSQKRIVLKPNFFLSLVIEQNDPRHVRPLPNLETKFVCANSLLGLPRPEGWELFQHQIEPHERALLDVRARYFFALPHEKDACRIEDDKLRRKLSEFIEGIGGSAAHHLASAVAAWNPYKPDRVAGYFDPESMFGVRDGFDITCALAACSPSSRRTNTTGLATVRNSAPSSRVN